MRAEIEEVRSILEGKKCPDCGGRGHKYNSLRDALAMTPGDSCAHCSRTGLDPQYDSLRVLFRVDCARCKGKGYYSRSGIGLIPQLSHYFNCRSCGGDGEELYQDKGPIHAGQRGTGYVIRLDLAETKGALSGAIGAALPRAHKNKAEAKKWSKVEEVCSYFDDAATLLALKEALG